MDLKEVRELVTLLNTLYTRSPHPERDARLLRGWQEALAEVTPEEAKRAVLTRLRENRFYPDIAEIMAYLPPPEKRGQTGEQEPWLRRCHERYAAACGAAGIPTLSRAREQGMTVAEWMALADEAGV